MSTGFNTDVSVGDETYHVQTEDRGPDPAVIDTAVYLNGQVLLRRSSNYADWANSPEFSEEELGDRVAAQHRAVIQELKSGALAAELAKALEAAADASGIQAQLLNPDSWLSGGQISLEIEVSRKADGKPLAGVQVEALIEGALEDARHSGTSDGNGRARLEFPLPPLGKGDLALVIQAQAGLGKDELRFAMRTRAKDPSSQPAT
jgi:hypothetical protein